MRYRFLLAILLLMFGGVAS